jgi:hypothetical protein
MSAHYCEAFADRCRESAVGVVLGAAAATMAGTYGKEKPVERQKIDDELSTAGA